MGIFNKLAQGAFYYWGLVPILNYITVKLISS